MQVQRRPLIGLLVSTGFLFSCRSCRRRRLGHGEIGDVSCRQGGGEPGARAVPGGSTCAWYGLGTVGGAAGSAPCAGQAPPVPSSPQPPLVDKLRLCLFHFPAPSLRFPPAGGAIRRSHRGHSRPTRNREWNHRAGRGGDRGAWRAAFRRNSRGPRRDRTEGARQVHVAGAPPGRFLFPRHRRWVWFRFRSSRSH